MSDTVICEVCGSEVDESNSDVVDGTYVCLDCVAPDDEEADDDE